MRAWPLILILIPMVSKGQDDSASAIAPDAFGRFVKPFIEFHCIECHDAFAPSADFNLEDLSPQSSQKTLEKIYRRIESGEMPPSTRPSPDFDAKESVLLWLSEKVETQANPPALRRLNRAEYRNTVRDLFAVDFDLNWFPVDEGGDGFDTNSNALSLSPLRFEKFVEAAEAVAAEALPDISDRWPRTFYGAESIIDRMRDFKLSDNARALTTNGQVSLRVRTTDPGPYLFRVRASAKQAGDELARMDLLINRDKVATFDVTDSNQVKQYETEVDLQAGFSTLNAAFVNDYLDPKDPKNGDRNLYVHSFELVGPLDRLHLTPFQKRLERFPLTDREEWRDLVEYLAERAYRRPVDALEIERLLDFASFESDELKRLRLLVTALAASPHFLFRGESRERSSGIAPSTPRSNAAGFAIASRLSYFLWSSMPDESLFDAARQGLLNEDDELLEQTRRMLRDPKADSLVSRFAAQWLGLQILDDHSPDLRHFPEFDQDLKVSMLYETERFVESILRENHPIRDLLCADYTFVNERLATYYGLIGIQGPHHRRVSLAHTNRRGLLTQGAILTLTSEPARTSPVKRGHWILSVLLGAPPPPPPPGIEALPVASSEFEKMTLRESMERHREDVSCASCHARMDPLGFALENFDATGRYRESENGVPIDSKGTLPDGRAFSGARELADILTEDHSFQRAFAMKLMTFSLGRELRLSDVQLVRSWFSDESAVEVTFEDLISRVVLSEPFRSGEG